MFCSTNWHLKAPKCLNPTATRWRPDPVRLIVPLAEYSQRGVMLVPGAVEKLHLPGHISARAAHSEQRSLWGGTRGTATANKAWHTPGRLLR